MGRVVVSPSGGSSSNPVVLALTVDATTNSTTTGVEITGLNQTTGTGTFVFQYFVRYQSAATATGVKFGVNHTGTIGTIVASMRGHGATTGAMDQADVIGPMAGSATRTRSTTAPDLGPTISVDTLDADLMIIIEGIVVVSVDGDLELWHASEVAAASTVKRGSSLILTKTAA